MAHVTTWDPDIHLQALEEEQERRCFAGPLSARATESRLTRSDGPALFTFRRSFVVAHD
jgi:hypothetical protein